MKSFVIDADDVTLYGSVFEPSGKAKGVVQILHGMCEHKERYYDFMKYLASNGYVAVIHDHRGHGKSINEKYVLGYFGNDKDVLVKDSYLVTKYIKEKYKGLKITLFGHSMGSLVARRYISFYDNEVDKLILCGTPTYNPLSKLGIILAKIVGLIKGDYYRSNLLNNLSLGTYSKKFDNPNGWISSNPKIIKKYETDERCGFTFTVNGFKVLFNMMDKVYNKKEYIFKNRKLPIFIIGGMDDPVVNGENKFNHLINFLKDIGYKRINGKLYEGLRHELLNEVDKDMVYKDILQFIEKN